MTTPGTERTTAGIAARIVIGALLILLAAIAWQGAGLARDLARAHERTATLQPAEAATAVSRWLTPLASLIDPDIERHTAVTQYWSRDYRSLADTSSAASGTAETLFTSANAAFRRAQADAAGRPLPPERLDQVLQAYAAALKNHGFDRDAAYNYEYVARLRDAAARVKPATKSSTGDRARSANPAGPIRPGELPPGSTIHGRPGTHPPATRGEEFEVLTPMDFGDREAQPEPTPGVKLPKKG